MDYIRPKIFDRHPIRNDELVLVELKKDGNRKVGAISELFFYRY